MASAWWWLGTIAPFVPCPPHERSKKGEVAHFIKTTLKRPITLSNPSWTLKRRCSVCKAVGHDARRHHQRTRRNPAPIGVLLRGAGSAASVLDLLD